MRRAVALAFVLAFCIVRYWTMRLRGPMTMARRTVWLQRCCRSVANCIGIRIQVSGTPPVSGLVVANHLGYLDIVVISAVMPCFFVAKSEVSRWPFFGRAAGAGGTIFLNRASRASASVAAAIIEQRLRDPAPVLLFPEGTSTDGSRVLRFHSRLIDPAVRLNVPITAAAIRYSIAGGTPEREACWFDDAAFLAHLWKVIGFPAMSAHVCFASPRHYNEPHQAAEQTHTEVALLRATGL